MKVYISYAHSDEKIAKLVATQLRHTGLEVWEASNEILPGDNWADKIAQGLKESEAMVVLLTPVSIKSSWVNREIEYALGTKEYSNRLIPVLIDPHKSIKQDDLPWILKHLIFIDLSEYEKEEGIKKIAEVLLKVENCSVYGESDTQQFNTLRTP
jgi:hypothetical protein